MRDHPSLCVYEFVSECVCERSCMPVYVRARACVLGKSVFKTRV